MGGLVFIAVPYVPEVLEYALRLPLSCFGYEVRSYRVGYAWMGSSVVLPIFAMKLPTFQFGSTTRSSVNAMELATVGSQDAWGDTVPVPTLSYRI